MYCAVVAAIAGVSIASVSDMPVRAQGYNAPVAAAVFDWSGFYAGANAGYAWAHTRATDVSGWGPAGTQWSADPGGFTGGLQAGWNVQMRNWVLGIEGDVGHLNISASARDFAACCGPPDVTLLETRGGWFGTFRGRAGVLLAPNILVYGTGGVIFADTRTNVYRPSDLRTPFANGWGWTAGGGVEVAINPSWSWKLEYLYYDLGTDRVAGNLPCGAGPCLFDIQQTGNIARVGINYRFGNGSIGTR